MRRIVAVAAFSLAVALSAAYAAQEATKNEGGAPKPAIEIPRMKIDLGQMFEREKYEYKFVVRNRGNADLVIQDVKPGCGCTAASFDKVIAPGKEGVIELDVDGAKVHGEFEKQATVETNDPDHPTLTIAVAGSEIPYVNVTPDGVVYLHGHYGENIEKVLTLSSNEKDADFKVTSVTSDMDDKITYKVEPGPKKGEYTLHVNKNPKLPTMSTYGSLFVHSNSKNAPETTLQVQVMTKGSINVTPSTVNFGTVKFATKDTPGTPTTRSILVSKTTGPFKVENVTLSSASFVAALEPVVEGQQYRIQVTFTPPVKRLLNQTETAEMIIHTDDAMEPAIRVHVVARTL